jgi:pimeloyl-[acyl-carrier protein] methyl ester esterase
MRAVRLVLLPGLDGSGEMSRAFARACRHPCDAIALPDAGPQGYRALAEQVREELPTAPFVLVAQSFSGPIAIELAAGGVPGLRALVLVATFARAPRPALLALASMLPLSLGFRVRPPAMALRAVGFGDAPPALVAHAQDVLREAQPSAMAARVRAVAMVDVRERLRSISVPCLYLRATRDRLVPAECAEVFRSHLSDLEIADVDAPHFVLQVEPERCAARIDAFVDRAG